jgi:hypothetical protein
MTAKIRQQGITKKQIVIYSIEYSKAMVHNVYLATDSTPALANVITKRGRTEIKLWDGLVVYWFDALGVCWFDVGVHIMLSVKLLMKGMICLPGGHEATLVDRHLFYQQELQE